MIPMLNNDKIKRIVIETLPADMVNTLADHKFTTEQLISNPSMILNSLPVDLPFVCNFWSETFLKRLEQDLEQHLTGLPTARDFEIYPALRASDLNARNCGASFP